MGAGARATGALIAVALVAVISSLSGSNRVQYAVFGEDSQDLRALKKLSPDNDTSSNNICDYDKYHGQDACDYAKADPDCSGERVNYLAAYACADDDTRALILIFYFVMLGVLFYLLGTTADKYFCPQVEELSDRLGLTPRVAGVTLLSLGNGAPDVFAGINAVKNNQIGLVLGQLTGGGMFVASVVAGGVIWVSEGIRTRFPLLRDIQLYMIAVAALLVMTAENALTFYTAAIMLAYYLSFVCLAYYSDRRLLMRVTTETPHALSNVPMMERSTTQAELLNKEYRLARKARMSIGNALDHLSYTSEGAFRRTLLGYFANCLHGFVQWCEAPFNVLRNVTVVNCVKECWHREEDSRMKATLAVLGTPLLIGFWQDILGEKVGVLPLWVLLLVVGMPAALAFCVTCPTDTPPRYSLIVLFVGFCTAAMWVDVFASELVDLLTAIGSILSVSEVTMGATVLAWGGCVGDLTADVLLARNKREGMAITACFAGPMFNLLIVIGFGVIVRDISHKITTSLTAQTVMTFSFLLASLLSSLVAAFGFGRCAGENDGNRLPKRFAFVLWAWYAAFFFAVVIYEIIHNPKIRG